MKLTIIHPWKIIGYQKINQALNQILQVIPQSEKVTKFRMMRSATILGEDNLLPDKRMVFWILEKYNPVL